MQIYIHRNNQRLGPLTESEVKAQLASGALSPQDHAWWQGQTTWLPLSQTPFASTIPHIPGAIPAVPGPHSNYEKTSNLALWALISGISSFFCGITFIPAIILGHMGLSETGKNPAIKGRGMAWAGLCIGYGVFVFYILVAILFGVFFALGSKMNGTLKAIEMKALQAQSSQEDSDSDQSTNSADQSTNNAPDSSTNSAPAATP